MCTALSQDEGKEIGSDVNKGHYRAQVRKKSMTLPESGNEGREAETRSISCRKEVSWVDVNINRIIQRDIQFLLNGIVRASDCTIDQIRCPLPHPQYE